MWEDTMGENMHGLRKLLRTAFYKDNVYWREGHASLPT